MGENCCISCIFHLFILNGAIILVNSQYCDEGKFGDLKEGNIGQDGAFPWLGVLRVHLHEGDTFRIAVTGIVLIKDKFALGNANDIVRIPRDLFQYDSKAMFIPRRDETWSTPVKDYVPHPEYEYSSYNTIVIVELKISMDDFIPVKPICWPKYSFNTSNQLYAVGFTDEHEYLEKEFHKLQFVKERQCDEFYTRSGLKENKMHPVHVQCAFVESAKTSCVWETGRAMASNASGQWTIIGLGVHGPGCAAPARFISFSPYLMWIQTVTELDQISDYRRSAFGIGFQKPKPKDKPRQAMEIPDVPEVPIHETFLRQKGKPGNKGKQNNTPNNDTTSTTTVPPVAPDPVLYSYQIKYDDVDLYKVDRVDDDAIDIEVFDDMYESPKNACQYGKKIIYNDETKIVAPTAHGDAVYRLSVHDMLALKQSCIKVQVKALSNEKIKLWWRESMDKYEATRFQDMGNLPKKLLKIIPIIQRWPKTNTSKTWAPKVFMEPRHLEDRQNYDKYKNKNLLIKFKFKEEAILKVSIFAPQMPPSVTNTNTTSTTNAPTTTPQSLRKAPDSASDEDYQPMYKIMTDAFKSEKPNPAVNLPYKAVEGQVSSKNYKKSYWKYRQSSVRPKHATKNYRQSFRRHRQSSARPKHTTKLLKVPRISSRLEKALRRKAERRQLERTEWDNVII